MRAMRSRLAATLGSFALVALPVALLALPANSMTLTRAPALSTPAPASSRITTDPTDWLGRVNDIRVASGVPAVTENTSWTAGIAAHLNYLAQTPASLRTGPYASAHTENPASPYYTPDGSLEGSRSDLVLGGSTSNVGAINAWLMAPFHAIGILRSGLQQVAFYRDPSTGMAGLDVIGGLSAPPSGAVVLYPGPGATDDLTRFGGESPSPIETCTAAKPGADYSAPGLPLIALLTQSPTSDLSATLTDPSGAVLSSSSDNLCVVDANNFTSSDTVYGPTGAAILAADNAVLVIPRIPLVAGPYTVTISQGGQADITWSFLSAPATPLNPPGPPTDLVTTPGNQQVTLSWRAPSDDGGEPITHYVATATPGGATCTATAATTCTVTGLTNGTPYTIAVVAVNAVGSGTPALATTTPGTSPVGDSASIAIRAYPYVRGSMVVLVTHWAIFSGASPVHFQYTLDGRHWITFGPIRSPSVVVTHLHSGRTYAIRVRMLDSSGVTTTSRPAHVKVR